MHPFLKASRLVDNKPWTVHLYATERCNLSCDYCNEFDNSAPHPPLADLKTWMRRLRELGVIRISFLGGEPLLHPDIVELVRYAKEIGFIRVGMSTNGFLLKQDLIDDLEKAGLDSCQVSVDRMTPTASTRKSLKSILSKIELFRGSKIGMTVTGVLFEDTLDEMRQVIDTCLEKDIPVSARLVHNDSINKRDLRSKASNDKLRSLLDYQIMLKARGEKIHTPWRIFDYQMHLLDGKHFEWKCIAGYKYFSVSGQGHFWPCSQLRTDKHIMDITPDDLLSYNRKKSCQEGCGVYCIINNSFMFTHPISNMAYELREMFGGTPAQFRPRRPSRS